MIALAVQDQSQVSEARRRATEIAQRQGFGEVDSGKVALVATELATNVLRHGRGGEILVGTYGDGPESGLELIALDNVVLLPHVASGTHVTRAAMRELTLANLDSWLADSTLRTPIPEMSAQ